MPQPLRQPDRRYPAPSRGGLTLVEVMFSVVVMSTMLVAALGAVGASAKTRIAQKESAIGLALARQLLGEIMQTRYIDHDNPVFGIETGETRATFDDVDDYNNWKETSAQYADGTAIPGATGWSRSAVVQWVNARNPTVLVGTDQGCKRITVTVTSPAGRITTLSALRAQADAYSDIPGSQVTYTSWVGVSIQVGPSTIAKNVQGANLVNLVP